LNVADTLILAAKGHTGEARDALGGVVTEVARGEEASALERAGRAGLVVVWEADGLLGRLAARAEGVALAPLGGEVAKALGMGDAAKALRRLEKAAKKNRLDAPATPSLRVTLSHEPEARVAWSVGTGLVAEVARKGVQAMGAALATERGLTLSEEAEPALMVLDGAPKQAPTWMMLSALERGALGLTFGEGGPRKREGEDAAGLAAAVAKGKVPLGKLLSGGDEGERFERVELDKLDGLAIDGAYVRLNAPVAVTVRQGPRTRLARA
jgi:hypothetical protein